MLIRFRNYSISYQDSAKKQKKSWQNGISAVKIAIKLRNIMN